ncbi:glycoside hydrolase family 32 protein [uncultured Propionibacterium sp.]|uniref:glycoside hydrolase family 32 protein n=1 Tax=uncultured Propionibacterium sp. TaxID=218066 RepID=UPI00292EAE0D|nr:glycoside hydrolase family 32 protein [uncultured Propionibacterium sp.]
MTDPALPVLHVRPPRGWVNDPNGLCRAGGRWHVFFQYNPDSPHHARIVWGHMSSADLAHWREEPIAMRPVPGGPDAAGCWSGCLTVDAGTPTICYTAMPGTPENAVGCIATGGPDLRSWTRTGPPSAGRVGPPGAHTRDPFVVSIGDRRCIVQGHGGPGLTPQVLVYDATDLTDWRLLGSLLDGRDPVAREIARADVWECPNLVRIDGQWVLLVSLLRTAGGHSLLSGVRWMRGELDDGGPAPRLVPYEGGTVDTGRSFYAPQVLVDDGRALLWGWARELDRDEDWLAGHGWSGTLTTPRELHLRDGRLVGAPAPEYLAHRAESLPGSWPAARAPAFRLTTTGPGALICTGAEGAGRIALPGRAQVLVDGSLVEVVSDEGWRTTRIYPTASSSWRVDGGGTIAAHALR